MISLVPNTKNEMQMLREQRDAAQKAFQDLIYVVSHDLGAPLRAVTGFSSILQNKYASHLDDRAQVYLNFIAQGGDKAQQMLAGLLTYSRVHTQITPSADIDLHNILEQVFEDLKDKITAHAALIDCGALPVIWGDSDQVAQLFSILIDNALTYQRPGIFPHIHIQTEDKDNFWKITVTDNGIGVTPENSERVFQIFKRLHADDAYPGIGMGLAIARRIVERHGGAIGIAPHAHGTQVWINLPKQGAKNGFIETMLEARNA